MKAADLREKSVEDLAELQKSLTGDVFQNRLKNFTNRLDDTSAIRKGRRDLARVLTLLRERAPKGTPAPAAKKPAAPKAKAKTAAPTTGAESKPKKTAAAKKSTGKKTEKSEAK